MGKIGTNIRTTNATGWWSSVCLLLTSLEQHQILQNYEQKDAEKVARMKVLYKELALQTMLTQYEEDS